MRAVLAVTGLIGLVAPSAASGQTNSVDWSCTLQGLNVRTSTGAPLRVPEPGGAPVVNTGLVGGGTAVCTAPGMPPTAEGFQVDVGLVSATSRLEVLPCAGTDTGRRSTTLYSQLTLTRHDGRQALGEYYFSVSGEADPRATGTIRHPRTLSDRDPQAVKGTGISDWDFMYSLPGQSRCLGDGIDQIDIRGSWASDATALNFASTSVFENGAFAQNIASATAATTLESLQGKLPELSNPLDPGCAGSMISAPGYRTHGNVAVNDGGDLLMVSTERLLTFTAAGENRSALTPLALGNGAAVPAKDGAAWKVDLEEGDRIGNFGPTAVGVLAADGRILALIALAASTPIDDYLEITVNPRTGDVVIREHPEALANAVPKPVGQVIFLANADPHDVTVCTGESLDTAPGDNRMYPQPPDGPDYYDRAKRGDAYIASRRRLSYCFTDTNDNTPFYDRGDIQGNVFWYCRNGTREKIIAYDARAEIQRQIHVGQVNYWSTQDRHREPDGKRAEAFGLFVTARCYDARYRTLTRMNFTTNVRGQLPDSPLYRSPGRSFDC
jgi:hypothetical protein